MPSDPTPPDDFDQRRARWITETQASLARLMEQHGMMPPETADFATVEIQTGPDPVDTTRVMIVGTIGDRDRAVAAIRESGLGRDVLIVGADVPICRDRDLGLSLGTDLMGLIDVSAFMRPVLMDVPLVRLPERPKQTKRAWRQAMKGTR